MDNEKIFYMNPKAKNIFLSPNIKFPILFEEAFRFFGNKVLYDFLNIIRTKEGYELTEITEHSKEKKYYEIEKFFLEDTYFIIKVKDITETKKIELQLKNIESISALNTLAAGVAHEIKNPLAAIDLHTQVILKRIKNGLNVPEEIIEYIKIIDEEQKRLGKIVNDFLLTSRKRELKLSLENINNIIDEVIELLKPEIDENSIKISKEYEKNPDIFVDKDYLKQAIINVIKNAIEALKIKERENKEIKIFTFYEKNIDSVGIKINDNGIGIEQDKLQKIFEPYFTTKSYGTGLGLTIVYKIIKEHDGDIKVESEKNKGTSFTLFLPVSRGIKLIQNSN